MIKEIINKFKEIDKSIKELMMKGLVFSLLLSMVSASILLTYQFYYISPDLYYIGISLFNTSSMFAVVFAIFALAFDKLKKELNN